jgi:hypothetical protein
MAEKVLWTFQDAVERLLDLYQETKSGRQHRLTREAVLNAYRDLPHLHDWSYYKRRHVFQTEADYSTGTIAYDHTGGASERLVTLAGGTFPTNAAFGVLNVGDDHWPVAARLSSTTLQLAVDRNPGADIAAGTSYTWYRESYPLPVLANRIGEVADVDDSSYLSYVDPTEALLINRTYGDTTADRPELFTIRNDDRYMNQLCVLFIPPPGSQRTYEFIEDASGAQLTVEKYSTGTASVSSGTATVTIATGVLDSTAHLGAVVRFSADGTNEPTSLRGAFTGTDNPYKYQRVITAIASTTSCTVDAVVATPLSVVKYTISSPIDVENGAMLTLFWRMCEREYAEISNKGVAEVAARRGRELEALLFAKDSDRRTSTIESAHMTGARDHGGFVLGSIDPSGET